jgi:CRP/FNR family transcriptional regulator
MLPDLSKHAVALRTERRIAVAQPLARIAALFVTLSRHNIYEGREPDVITDSLSCGLVAGYLNMSVDELAHLLLDLETRGLVAAHGGGLKLTNVVELERLSELAD